VRRSRPRAAVVAALVAVGVLVVPVVLEARSISEVGYFWQGRYTLPLAVGVPLVLAAGSRSRAGRPLLVLLLTALAACHLVGYVVALGRYTVGQGNGLGLVDEQWAPPLPALVLAVAFARSCCSGRPCCSAASGSRAQRRTAARTRRLRPPTARPTGAPPSAGWYRRAPERPPGSYADGQRCDSPGVGRWPASRRTASLLRKANSL
jgi:hypothetical protein